MCAKHRFERMLPSEPMEKMSLRARVYSSMPGSPPNA
ncbi:MAG: hypothetical protein BWY59_01504 [Verrucomicrobia bacterium ADurb.Bin345]|nr:MAG: hypothetical protein BWY59_01504 [Verrucomicrobia bacterium ADurb.Bin345]